MKIINSIMRLLKNEAFNGVSTLIAILLILISPDHRIVLGLLATLLFILVVIGHVFENTIPSDKTKNSLQNFMPMNFVDLAKHALPIVSAIVVVMVVAVFTTTLLDKSSRAHATFFGGWVDKIIVPYRDTPISLLAIAPKGLLHDVFEKAEPYINFDEKGKVTLTFKWVESDADFPSGIFIEHAGLDNGNIIYEPTGDFMPALNYQNESGLTKLQIDQYDTIFLRLSDSTYARMHFSKFNYDYAYGNLVSVEIYISYLGNGKSHFEGLTQP